MIFLTLLFGAIILILIQLCIEFNQRISENREKLDKNRILTKAVINYRAAQELYIKHRYNSDNPEKTKFYENLVLEKLNEVNEVLHSINPNWKDFANIGEYEETI